MIAINLVKLKLRVCRMNEDRQIAARSWHNFHFLPHFNSKTAGPVHQIFIRCRSISAGINAHIYKAILQSVLDARAKSEDGQFWRLGLQKAPKINGYNSYCKTYASFIMHIHMSINVQNLVKIGPLVYEIFGGICRFLPSHSKRCICYPGNLWNYYRLYTSSNMHRM